MQQQTAPFRRWRDDFGGLLRFMFRKTF